MGEVDGSYRVGRTWQRRRNEGPCDLIDLSLRHQIARRMRVVAKYLLAVALLACCSTRPPGSDMVSSHVIAFAMDDAGAIRPDAYFLRNRYLEPKSEQEILRVLSLERVEPPI